MGPQEHKILGEEARGSRYSLLPVTVIACMLSHFGHVQLFETLWPGSSAHGVLQARILEWVAMLSSGGSSPPRDQTRTSCSFFIVGGFFITEPQGKPSCH